MHQQVPTELGEPPQTLLLDADRSRLLTEFRELAARSGFRPGDDLLAFYDLPGLVFAVGGRSPGQPWYLSTVPESNQAALARIPAERLEGPYIAMREGPTGPPELAAFGIRFPEDYDLRGSVRLLAFATGARGPARQRRTDRRQAATNYA